MNIPAYGEVCREVYGAVYGKVYGAVYGAAILKVSFSRKKYYHFR